MSDLGANSREQLAGFIQRIESLEVEKAQVSEKIKAEYAEAAAAGFDKKALRQVLKRRRADLSATAEHRAIVETYMAALGQLVGTELGDWATAWAAAQTTANASPSYAETPATKRNPRSDLN